MKQILYACPLVTALSTSPASAAEDHVDAGDTSLEEIVVTAERRAEDPRQMPVSVIALTHEDLQNHDVQNVQNLQFLTPSLSFVDLGNVKFINIRGVGLNEGAPNQTDGVASHIDGAYVAQVFTVDDAYFDLESVEVLRGPQGTYEGQNAEGGAIFINTTAPSLSGLNGFAEAKFGSFQEREIGAAVNLPVGNTLAVRISGQEETRNSYTTNLGPYGGAPGAVAVSDQPGDLRRTLGRAQVLFEPTDELSLRLIYQTSYRNTDGLPFVLNAPAGLSAPRTVSYDYPESYDIKYQRTTGILDWKFNPAVRLHVVASYQSTDQYIAQDEDGTSPYVAPTAPQSAFAIDIHDWYSTFEADLISTSDSALQWTAGVTELSYHQPFTDQIFSYNVPPGTAYDPNSGLFLNFHTFRRNAAAFGEVTYTFSPQWDVKLGGRYNYDHLGIQGDSYLIPFGGPLGPVQVPVGPNEPTYHAGTGRAVIDFHANSDNLIYATVGRGYKPGGWTPNIGAPADYTNVYKAEYVLNTELGWKASFFSDHLRTAVDVFHMKFDNYQATVASDPNDPATTVTTNVHGTKIDGVEAQLQAAYGGFTADAGFSFLNARYGNLAIFETPGIVGPNLPAAPLLINLGGREVDYAPRESASLGVAYKFEVGPGQLTPRLDLSYQAKQWTNFFEAPWQVIPSRSLLDFRLVYNPKPDWRLEGYVTNLTNKLYAVGVGEAPYAYEGSYYFGPPRLYGLQLTYKF